MNFKLLLVSTLGLAASLSLACSDEPEDGSSGNPNAAGDSGASGASGTPGSSGSSGSSGVAGASGGGSAGAIFNQCGVAAPLPAETGQCTRLSAPTFADFDDYAGTEASSYSYSLNAESPTDALRGALLHVGDGSDTNGGTSVITTEMVTGVDDAGYALQISNTNAMNWGGLLMFYFPFGGEAQDCLDASAYGGVEFSIRGESPSGRFGVNLGMLDTTPTADGGLCDTATADECKNANIELNLPSDPTTWERVRVPWSSFTPGVGSALACVPLTGQNIVRLVIQPFMTYPPPDFMFEPGAYSIAVDQIRFY